MDVRITAMRMARHTDLMAQYENLIEHACDLQEGQVFTARGGEKPAGFCDSAWETLAPFVRALAQGGGDFFDGWMKNRRSAMLSCNDGFRPVSFLLEALPEYRYLFFDLDGTLAQSEYGIVDSVLYTLEQLGIRVEDRAELNKFIGPPMYEAFKSFCGFSPEEADRAVACYRRHYAREGIFLTPLYDGIEKMLEDLAAMGKELFVVTSKPKESAEVLLEHTGILHRFQEVIGPDGTNRHPDKAVLIRKALDGIAEKETEAAACHALMVGDRFYDIKGAVAAGVDSVGVLYGYGSRRELQEAGATYLAGTPAEITDFVRRACSGDGAS